MRTYFCRSCVALFMSISLHGCCDFEAECNRIEDGTGVDAAGDEMCDLTSSHSLPGHWVWESEAGETCMCTWNSDEDTVFYCDYSE